MTNNLEIHKNPSLYYDDHQSDVGYQILDALNRMHEYDLEELVNDFFPSYTWNQIFLAVDHMSRTGSIRLFFRGPGLYAVSLPLHMGQQQSEERLLASV